jgi:hypothetical protein
MSGALGMLLVYSLPTPFSLDRPIDHTLETLSGEGRYEYGAGKSTVVWKTGPYVNVWGGEVTVEREGKTHKIRMKRNTIATNSTDSQR